MSGGLDGAHGSPEQARYSRPASLLGACLLSLQPVIACFGAIRAGGRGAGAWRQGPRATAAPRQGGGGPAGSALWLLHGTFFERAGQHSWLQPRL